MEQKMLDNILNNKFLSWKDKGILIAFIRSIEKGERLSMKSMVELSSDGISTIRSSVKFLIDEGYLKRVYRGAVKNVSSVEYLVNEERFSDMNE